MITELDTFLNYNIYYTLDNKYSKHRMLQTHTPCLSVCFSVSMYLACSLARLLLFNVSSATQWWNSK